MRRLIISCMCLLLGLWPIQLFCQDAPRVRLEPFVQGLRHPVHAWHDGVTQRLYVVEQSGVVRVVVDGKLQPRPFLDISQEVEYGGECGLLSIAFSPDFAANGLFYVNYTAGSPRLRTVIAEFHAQAGASAASPQSRRVILEIDQPFSNHNGGHILFGPDGMLYIGMGDGGAANDPHNNAQNPRSLLGKILRIDVTPRDGYAVPADNPFVKDGRFRPEIWALGMRNPWRLCFDPDTDEMIAGDVGQNEWEEIQGVKAGTNGGWRPREGAHPNPNIVREEPITIDTDPIVEYRQQSHPHAGYRRNMRDNCVIGGLVYRGENYPALAGWYLYADNGSGRIWGLKRRGGRIISNMLLLESTTFPSSFGEDARGELYLCDHRGGRVFRIVAE